MVIGYVPRRGIGASLLVTTVFWGIWLGTSPGDAQETATPPLGLPEAAPLTNPFPAAPSPETPPNFQYQSNLEPNMGLVPGPGLQIVPRISGGEEFNDNIFQSETDRRWDLITLISPGIAISNDTPKLRLSLNYNPVFRIYGRTSSEDSVGQQLMAAANAVIVPDQFYVNARAFATEVPVGGGFTGLNFGVPTVTTPTFTSGTLGLNKNNLSQVESASLTPYLVHRFGTFGTGKAGINLTQSYTSSTSSTLIGGPTGPSEHSYTGEGILQFVSGDDWGRVVNVATLDASKTTGTGVLSNSTRAVADDRLGYVVRPWFLPFGEFGYESIQYAHTTPSVSINDGIWGVGTTLLPNSDSRLTVEYGHHDGITGWQAAARYSPTARTVLALNYTTGITSDLQQIESQLEGVGINPLGNAINLDTGAPISLINSLAGINNTIYKNHQLTATATTLLDRNTLSLSFQRQYEQPIATTGGQPLVNSTSTSGTATWVHEISLRTSLTTSGSYGVRTVQQQNENFFGASAQLRYLFTDKLSGSAIYSFYDRHSNVPGVSMYENIVLISLTRTF